MFAQPEFADFSQQIGLASLGCSESELLKLAALYWFTVEFGLCREGSELKVYGGGILSGLAELDYCMSDVPKYFPLDAKEITENHLNYVINDVQPYYFVADSFKHALQVITDYCNSIKRPFDIKL
jgi:phenylalanine-4-hydroxylase